MKYDALSSSDSWLSSSAVLDAMTARPFCVIPETELYEKSAAGSAPLTRENEPLWQASRTTMVIVEGTARSVAQGDEGELLVAEVDGGRPRMARVVEEDLGLLAARGVRPRARGDVVHRREQVRRIGSKEDPDVAGVVVPELPQDLGHALRVVLGEAERLLPGAPDVVAHDDRVRMGAQRRRQRVGTSVPRVGERSEAGQNEGAGGQGGTDAGTALHWAPPVNSRPPRRGNPSPRISGGPSFLPERQARIRARSPRQNE